MTKVNAHYDEQNDVVVLETTGAEVLALLEKGKMIYTQYELGESFATDLLCSYTHPGTGEYNFEFARAMFRCSSLSEYPTA